MNKPVKTHDLTAEEQAKLFAAADRDHLSISQWVARAVRKALASGRPL